jgi:hypothetical protein
MTFHLKSRPRPIPGQRGIDIDTFENCARAEVTVQASAIPAGNDRGHQHWRTLLNTVGLRIVYPRIQNSAAPFWAIALLLGLIQAWVNRFYMGNDGVSYLDMADAYLRGDWHTALNGSWNPLYAWLIGLDFLVFRPSPYWEYPAVQLLNFGVYAVTVVSFEYFLRGLLAWKRGDAVAVRVIAYGLFLWSALILIRVWTVNADMLVAASLYAALGLLLRAHNAKAASVPTSVLLGMTLAIGYYSKAVMFPLSLALLLIALIVLRWRRTLIAAFVFSLLSAPLILGVSKSAGHLTFGDTGRVNYAWYVNGVASRWWQGGPSGSGQPKHPPRIALDSPRVYEFGGVFPEVTYPIWYDFSYWYQGLQVRIDPRRLASVMPGNLKGVLKLLALQGGGFVLGWGICLLLYSRDKTRIHKDLVATWPAWGASIAAILLYSAVHIEPRYVGAFAVVLPLTAFTAIHVPGKRLATGIAIGGLAWSMCFSSTTTVGGPGYPLWPTTTVNVSWQVATGLQKLGLHPNEKVASVSYSNRRNVFWARLAKAHIVAEMDWNVDFWRLSEVDQRRALAALARSGALMAVSDETPPDPARAVGWRRAGSTSYYAYSLSQ